MSRPRFHRFIVIGVIMCLVAVGALAYTHVNPSIARAEDDQQFMSGVDASTLLAMEQHGARYFDHGRQEDFLDILKHNGVNSVRLRLWVDPANPPQLQPGVDSTQSTLIMAKRLKQAGLQFYLDLHYSDTWADPGHQTTPLAWANETPSQLAQSVYTYTKGVFTALKAQGTLPQLVQIGNETNCGMLGQRDISARVTLLNGRTLPATSMPESKPSERCRPEHVSPSTTLEIILSGG